MARSVIRVARSVSQIKARAEAEDNKSEDFLRCANVVHFGRSVLRCRFVCTFCSSSHGSKKLAPVTASSIFLKCFVLPHQTRPNVRAEYLVWENKQFQCPGDLRGRSFGRQVDADVALSN